ncbi:MAG: phosphatase PAP2 family protein [bacterium LCO1.1]|uniref:Phosphatase PAP2 family protein n=1 Tax=Candidatus Weimeria bifida TaxID=2599074 RepID=A0A6N7J230_9FIRM|nr:phosphatase PAP2 family protein [Candidatus Weimeria bifida]
MQWEFNILYWFQSLHHPVLDPIEKFITMLGSGGIFWILLTIAIIIFVKDKRVGLTCMLALAAEAILVLILKNTVRRSRPIWIDPTVKMIVKIPKDYSFPSGHSAAGFSVAVSIFCYNKKWGTAAIVLASLIALSRLYLFVHFPTDVMVGTMIGIVMALLMNYFVKKKFPQRLYIKKNK